MRRAVKQTSQDRGIQDVLEGGEVSIPLDGMDEPRLRRGQGGVRNQVLPGNKEFVEGDVLPRPRQGGGRARDAGEGDGEDAFRFVLSRDEFVDLFLDDLELPDLAKRKLAEAESEGLHRAGYATSGSPANISVSRTVRLAMARRVALRRPRPETIAELEAELAEADVVESGHLVEQPSLQMFSIGRPQALPLCYTTGDIVHRLVCSPYLARYPLFKFKVHVKRFCEISP